MKRSILYGTLAFMLFLTACSSNGNNNNTAGTPSGSAPQTSAAASPSAEPAKDPLGKYETPIEVTTARSLGSTVQFAEGESLDNNVWYRGYKDDLGIILKNEWTVPDAQYGQKMNVSIASGSIPDIVAVDLTQLQKLIESDMIMDMTEVYEQYASELTKQTLSSDGGVGWTAVTFGGKKMALPSTASVIDGTQMIWIREDWLKKVGLSAPKTIDDVLKIAEAFVKQKPGGQDKTYGLALGKDIYSGYGGIGGLAYGFKAYPKAWVKGADGKLAYGSTQPVMKQALAKLQDMFKAGLIDPEFGVYDANKVNELITSGKIGMFYGQHWNAFWPLPDSFKNDKNANWVPYPIASADSSPASSLASNGALLFYAVKKGAKNPEALVKLLNYSLEKQYGANGRDKRFFNSENTSLNLYAYDAVTAQDPLQNINIYRGVKKAFEAKSDEGLSFDVKDNYGSINKYLAGDNTFWASYKWAGPDGALSVEDYYDQQKLIVLNGFLGAPTATMLKKSSTLDTLELETFTKIILNAAPVDSFDTFVDNWKKLGGDEITKEVNDWAAAK
ncbi:extracellular solute-binding protein [Cohnella silvisoli]|uniref:Extracellular solute-binding protein n=1 Tax=Cohnella silvisoli TaxID=2873699 RepID=A0ABV1KRR8_9BACL|nr:extracellular solute-binding protein [Cohnella silvisoli]MCD9022499.1 extracellular solute-binding protein [Cohnella silvisoli]